MGNGRILHLAIDEKFIDYAYQSFENVAPGLNDFFIFVDNKDLSIRKTPFRTVRRRDRFGLSLCRKIACYDLVVIHSLHPFWIPVINKCSDTVRFAWIGWGYDYYDLLYPDSNSLLLEATCELRHQTNQTQSPKYLGLRALLNALLERLCLDFDKYRAITHISYFAPVLPDEYPLVRAAFDKGYFPEQAEWNYGSLEEVWAKEFLGRNHRGCNIFLGNSASYTSNHLDVLNWLANIDLRDRQVICTLSYGDDDYAKSIRKFGEECLPSNFKAIMNYMPLIEYVDLVSSCSHMIMNHIRQQGVGILIIMLYLGVMVFVREESPTLTYLRRLGFFVGTVQELMKNPDLLNHALPTSQIQRHKDILRRHWSKQAIDNLTRNLLARGGVMPN